MAAKQEHNKKIQLPFFKSSISQSDTSKHSNSESLKEKFSKLFSATGRQFSPKIQLSKFMSSFPGLSPKSETHEKSKIGLSSPKQDELCSSQVTKMPSKMKELTKQTDGVRSNIAMTFHGSDQLSPGIAKLSPKGQELSQKNEGLCFKKGRSVVPEIFIFPPDISEVPPEDEPRRGHLSKPRRIKSESKKSTERGKEQQRKRVESEPCINKYAPFISNKGIQLTEAANELTEERCRLLYEDIFKPLDIYSILQERSKNVSQLELGI